MLSASPEQKASPAPPLPSRQAALEVSEGGSPGCPRGVSPPAALPGGWSRGGRRQSESREGSRGESTWEIPWLVPQIDVFLALEEKRRGKKIKLGGRIRIAPGAGARQCSAPLGTSPSPSPSDADGFRVPMQGAERWARREALPRAPPGLLGSAPSPARRPRGRRGHQVLPGRRRVPSRRWRPAGARPLRRVYLT